MADQKISNLTELAAVPDATDEFVVVDKSDTTMSASGTDKRLKAQNLPPMAVSVATYASTYLTHAADYPGLLLFITDSGGGTLVRSNGSSWPAVSAALGIPATGINTVVSTGLGPTASVTSAGTNRLYVVPIMVPMAMTVTGIIYGVGATSNGNVRVGLFSGDGITRTVTLTTNAGQGTASTYQQVAFNGVQNISPGLYLGAIIFSSATATFKAYASGFEADTNNASMTIPTTVTPPTVLTAACPQLMLY